METQFNIWKILDAGKISNDLDYERALIADRKLRVLAQKNRKFISIRSRLRDLIGKYEDSELNESNLTNKRIKESDLAELIAEKERVFVQKRKDIIKARLKKLGLTQQNLGSLLGHRSKTYMSELMNGVSPFTLNDLVIIHRLLGINLDQLVPTILSQPLRVQIQSSLKEIGNKNVRLTSDDFDLEWV